jgi:hypothetical protein
MVHIRGDVSRQPTRYLRCSDVPLAIDISRAIRSRADQQALVRAVLESPANEQESHYLEWKGPLTLVGKGATGRASIAKAVLGFANRDPSVASRAMGGCAYLLAGVSPGQLCGVEAVDGAQLEAQVATYVGGNVDWRADYVMVDKRSVLVVTVEAPQWGDPVHPARKTFNPSDGRGPAFQEGTVFVRHQASTDPATAADLDMLSRRATRRPGGQLEVECVRPPRPNCAQSTSEPMRSSDTSSSSSPGSWRSLRAPSAKSAR